MWFMRAVPSPDSVGLADCCRGGIVGFALQICRLWSENDPGLTKLVSPNHTKTERACVTHSRARLADRQRERALIQPSAGER